MDNVDMVCGTIIAGQALLGVSRGATVPPNPATASSPRGSHSVLGGAGSAPQALILGA